MIKATRSTPCHCCREESDKPTIQNASRHYLAGLLEPHHAIDGRKTNADALSRKCISSVLIEKEAAGQMENALKLQSKGSGNAGHAQNSLVSRMYSLTYFHVGAPPNEGNPSLRSCIRGRQSNFFSTS